MANRPLSLVALWAALAGSVIPAANGQLAPRAQVPVQEILDAHNQFRRAAHVPALNWSSDLANHAQRWADHLASTGKFDHGGFGRDEGQNLWEGTSGGFTGAQMVGAWGAEKQWYHSGIFPNVSTTGNWQKVGHYTQLIWKDTREVGCGLATGKDYDVLVCNYSPPGNMVGESVQ